MLCSSVRLCSRASSQNGPLGKHSCTNDQNHWNHSTTHGSRNVAKGHAARQLVSAEGTCLYDCCRMGGHRAWGDGLAPAHASACTVTKSIDRRNLKAVTMSCKMQTGMTMTVDSFSSIDKPTETHGSLHMTATVPENLPAAGMTTSVTETRGRFLSNDCGSVVPGRNVPEN